MTLMVNKRATGVTEQVVDYFQKHPNDIVTLSSLAEATGFNKRSIQASIANMIRLKRMPGLEVCEGGTGHMWRFSVPDEVESRSERQPPRRKNPPSLNYLPKEGPEQPAVIDKFLLYRIREKALILSGGSRNKMRNELRNILGENNGDLNSNIEADDEFLKESGYPKGYTGIRKYIDDQERAMRGH